LTSFQGVEGYYPSTPLPPGIVPIFSNGNSGPSCNTANSPADMLTVIGVGATDVNDGLGSFSSKGPTVAGQIKPDISAPGVKVRSSTNSGDSAYAVLSGTSMAAPHTTGVVALILNSNPSMSFEELKKVLFTNVDISSLKPSNQKCGGTADTTYPNNQFGYGRISVAKALKL
jgi:subtilisin family serine protease